MSDAGKITYDVFFQIEKEKHPDFTDAQAHEIARLRVDRSLRSLESALAARLLPHEILTVALGTLIAGYGDYFVTWLSDALAIC